MEMVMPSSSQKMLKIIRKRIEEKKKRAYTVSLYKSMVPVILIDMQSTDPSDLRK